MNLTVLSAEEIELLRQNFGILDFDDDDVINRFFITGVLDRFDRILTEEEASK
ncbi:hypothetical protein [Paenibacillus rhizophilus]|uniref:hypothetical protein n=1 Tax=Paenibacillus rhizophilus TaxID=1850366 RepID=UPI00163AAEB5|nr:hypothetical protein [Paenibacillus rhizophilus]